MLQMWAFKASDSVVFTGVTTASPVQLDRDRVFVRLDGGHMATGGIVEVFANGQWGTICDDGWDDRDAAVICRMIGFSE